MLRLMGQLSRRFSAGDRIHECLASAYGEVIKPVFGILAPEGIEVLLMLTNGGPGRYYVHEVLLPIYAFQLYSRGQYSMSSG